MTSSPSSPPLVRLVAVDDIPPAGLPLSIVATDAERASLATVNRLVAIGALTADLMLRHVPRGGVHVTGHVAAELMQTCVVSLDAFDAALHEPVDVLFLPAASLEDLRSARARRPAPAEDEPEEDEPDLIEHGRIDVGGLVAEHLTLGLDPYPRKPGAVLEAGTGESEPTASPFAVLRRPDGERS